MRVIAVAVALVMLTGELLEAQRRHPVSGRMFAPVMGVGGAGWLERPERESEEAPSKAIDALEFKEGMVVADIGGASTEVIVAFTVGVLVPTTAPLATISTR